MDSKEKFLVTFKNFDETTKQIKFCEEKMNETSKAHYEFKNAENELERLNNRLNRLRGYIQRFKSDYDEDTEEILKNLIVLKENQIFYNLFDEIDLNSSNRSFNWKTGRFDYKLKLYYKHLNNYDIKNLFNEIEKATGLEITEFYLSIEGNRILLDLKIARRLEEKKDA